MAEQQIPDDIMQAAREALADAMGGRYSFDEFAAVFARAILAERRRSQAMTDALAAFAPIAHAILSEAPADSTYFSVFLDCQGQSHRIGLNHLRELSAPPSPLGAGKEG